MANRPQFVLRRLQQFLKLESAGGFMQLLAAAFAVIDFL
jgi:hypothetical protein